MLQLLECLAYMKMVKTTYSVFKITFPSLLSKENKYMLSILQLFELEQLWSSVSLSFTSYMDGAACVLLPTMLTRLWGDFSIFGCNNIQQANCNQYGGVVIVLG